MGWIRYKKWLNNLIIVLISIVVSIISAELILRVVFPLSRTDYSKQKHYYKVDEELGFDINESFNKKVQFEAEGRFSFPVWSNECGCFDEKYNNEEDFVLLVGDSFVWGYVPYEDTIGKTIEALVGKRVLKCGVGGYETKSELIKTKKVLKKVNKLPKLIIVGYFAGNDLSERWVFPEETVIDGFRVFQTIIVDFPTGAKKTFSRQELTDRMKTETSNYMIKNWLNTHLVLYNLAKRSIFIRKIGEKAGIVGPLSTSIPMSMELPEKYPWLYDAWNLQLSDIKEFKRYADSIEAGLLFILIPHRFQVYEFMQQKHSDVDYELPNRILGDFFQKEKIEFLDLLPFFKKYSDQSPRKYLDPIRDLYYKLDGHWSPLGSRLAGLLTSRYILEKNLIKIDNGTDRLLTIENALEDFNKTTRRRRN